ncbi:MAG: hypothetical protein P8179_19210 [Candidatus Thiodiazotropha sp.]
MKRSFALVAIVSIFASPLACSAADFENCKVTEIVSAGINNAHVAIDCAIDPRPACATPGNYFGFDKSTEEGKQYMSMILTAFASGSTLTGYVDNAQCSPYQENVAWLKHLRMRK